MTPLFSSGVKATSNAVLPFKCPSPKGSRHQSSTLTRLFYSREKPPCGGFFSPKPSLIALCLLIGGCGGGDRVTTNSVLANSNCKGTLEPIKLVSLADVAGYRGTQLLQTVDSTTEQTATNPEATAQPDSDRPLFVALSRGVQPTRGFELHLADQALIVDGPEGEGQSLEIPVHWTVPDPQKSHPLVNTHPCLVVSVPNAGWQRIEAVDQDGNSLGSLSGL